MKTKTMILTLVLTLTVGAAQQAQAQGILGRIRDAVGNAVPKKEQPAQPQPTAAPRVEGRTPSQIIADCPAFPSLNDLVITSVSYNMQLHGEPFYAEWKNALVRSDAYRHSIGALDDEVVALRDQITEAMRAHHSAGGRSLRPSDHRPLDGRDTEHERGGVGGYGHSYR